MTGRELVDAAVLSSAGHAYLRVREPQWANPEAYARLSVLATPGGWRQLGPWLHLFDRRSQEVIGEPTPQVLLFGRTPRLVSTFLTSEQTVYTGPLDPADG